MLLTGVRGVPVTTLRRAAIGVGALLVLLAVVLAVPFALWRTVGNPWPGWERIQLGDELGLVTGVLAVVAWLVWARFVVVVVGELRLQVRMALTERDRRPDLPPTVVVPPPSRAGVGLLAQRLVAAVLVLLPFAMRATPGLAEEPAPLRARTAVAALVVERAPAMPAPAPSSNGHRVVATHPQHGVVVEPGDTLIGLARTHLGDGGRWREIFDLNRDRPQPGGGHLKTPGVVRAGWTLQLPAGAHGTGQPSSPHPGPEAPAPYLPGAPVVVEPGDTLWDLSHDRLAAAGASHDDAGVVVYLDDVIAANAAVVVDPDVIVAGQHVELPVIGTPPIQVPVPAAAPAPAAPDRVPPAVTAPASLQVAPAAPETTPEPRAPAGEVPAAAVIGATASAVGTATQVPPASAVPTTTIPFAPADDPGRDGAVDAGQDDGSPSPIGLGEAALLSAGVLALLAARRRMRMRSALPRARVPEPAPDQVATERTLRSLDASERVLRLDVAVRAAAHGLLDSRAQIAVICVAADGTVELTLTSEATLAHPWSGARGRWVLPGAVPIERLAETARTVGAPCVALIQLGVDDDGREVFVDLEALGVIAVDAAPERADAVVRAMAATLGTSVFSEIANLVAVGLEPAAFLDHRSGHHVGDIDDAISLATTLVGSTATARTSTFDLRARHTSGEAWEPAVVLCASSISHHVTSELVRRAARRRGGLAVVVAGHVDGAPWTLRATPDSWVLEPIGMRMTPVALSVAGLTQVDELLRAADAPLLDEPDDDGHVPSPLRQEGSADTRDELRLVDGCAGPLAVAEDVAVVEDLDVDVALEPAANVVALSSLAAAGDDRGDSSSIEPPWTLLVRVLGPVEVVDRDGQAVHFEKSKALELVAWLALHRERPTRAGARTALWNLDVRDATFANVVSQARRAMARHVAPPDGVEWLGRTLTDRLPLHPLVVTDADLLRARLDHARHQPSSLAIETLRPAVELVRNLPFAGTGYRWPEPEGIASNLVLLVTSASTELAAHHLSLGDVDGVFWATGQGLKVLPGHEELIALRMRAHARSGDMSGVRLEWECYERVLDADPWGGGEPAQKLVLLRRELLAS